MVLRSNQVWKGRKKKKNKEKKIRKDVFAYDLFLTTLLLK